MYYFIVNPNARRGLGGKLWRKLERRLKKRGVEYEAMLTEKPGDARVFARRLTDHCRDPRTLVVVGGGGTINEVVDGLAFDGLVMVGCIPAGIGNDLARTLRLPGNWKGCLKRIMNPKGHRVVDYGVVSYGDEFPVHRRFMTSCGIGMDAAVCHGVLDGGRARGRRLRIPSRLVYVIHGILQLLKSRPAKGYLLLNGIQKVEFNHIYFVSVHIHPYECGGFCLAPRADGGDGLLEVCVVHGRSKLLLFPILLDARLSRGVRHKGMRRYSCHDLRVHMERPMPVHVDGESCCCQTDLELRCIERKVRLLV